MLAESESERNLFQMAGTGILPYTQALACCCHESWAIFPQMESINLKNCYEAVAKNYNTDGFFTPSGTEWPHQTNHWQWHPVPGARDWRDKCQVGCQCCYLDRLHQFASVLTGCRIRLSLTAFLKPISSCSFLICKIGVISCRVSAEIKYGT